MLGLVVPLIAALIVEIKDYPQTLWHPLSVLYFAVPGYPYRHGGTVHLLYFLQCMLGFVVPLMVTLILEVKDHP